MPPPFQIVSRTLGSEHDAGRWGNIERISRTVLCLEFLAQSGATSFLHFAGINASIATCMDMFFYVELLQMRIETAGFDSSKVQCQWFLAQLKRFGT